LASNILFKRKGLIKGFCNSGIVEQQAAAGSPLEVRLLSHYSLPANELPSHAYMATNNFPTSFPNNN
jgi:hypothetical protein